MAFTSSNLGGPILFKRRENDLNNSGCVLMRGQNNFRNSGCVLMRGQNDFRDGGGILMLAGIEASR